MATILPKDNRVVILRARISNLTREIQDLQRKARDTNDPELHTLIANKQVELRNLLQELDDLLTQQVENTTTEIEQKADPNGNGVGNDPSIYNRPVEDQTRPLEEYVITEYPLEIPRPTSTSGPSEDHGISLPTFPVNNGGPQSSGDFPDEMPDDRPVVVTHDRPVADTVRPGPHTRPKENVPIHTIPNNRPQLSRRDQQLIQHSWQQLDQIEASIEQAEICGVDCQRDRERVRDNRERLMAIQTTYGI